MKKNIKENIILDILEESKKAPKGKASAIVDKALDLKGLSPEEAAVLLQCTDQKVIQKIFNAARKAKEAIYGKRLVLFAPLYLSNYCMNDCLYCAFRSSNQRIKRKALTLKEIENEVKLLEKQGHKRLLLVAGEHPKISGIEYLEEAVQAVYRTKVGDGEIRRVNVNAAPMSVEHFKRLKKTGIGTYQLFQETYHLPTYKRLHLSGPKTDYENRLYAMDRAFEAGIDDLGIGVLFGLYDYKFEVLALLLHSQYLDKTFGAGPHTISVPRIEPALGAPIAENPPYPVSDDDFKKLVAIIRLAVPYTGMILSTRERAGFRDEVFNLGISQISAGSRTNPGGYGEDKNKDVEQQFELFDSRSLAEVIHDINKDGFIPSFCTACYRLGRTGHDFMSLAKPGNIQNFCLPNALLTFKEYLMDYASPADRKMGEAAIQKQIGMLKNKQLRESTALKLSQIEQGARDQYC